MDDRYELYRTVEEMGPWSPWRPWFEGIADAPTSPGVYLFRLSRSRQIVYVGMAGPRSAPHPGVRGRLMIYKRGRGATSGFGQAALDRALQDDDFVESRLAELRNGNPRRAHEWAQDAIDWADVEVCWTTCATKAEALELERRVERVLLHAGLWNRSAMKAAIAPHIVSESAADPELARDAWTEYVKRIDLELLYAVMWSQSTEADGFRVMNGHAKGVTPMKRLLNKHFDVPVRDKSHPVNARVRNWVNDELTKRGWVERPRNDGYYVLLRDIDREQALGDAGSARD